MCVYKYIKENILRYNRDRKNKTVKVQVSFTEKQWEIIERLQGIMGSDAAEIVRNIVLAWLSEKSFVSHVTRLSENEGLKG